MSRRASRRPYVLDEQIGFILCQVVQRHVALFDRLMGGDLTPTQWAALSKLAEVGTCSQNQLGRLTAMDVVTIKGVIDDYLTGSNGRAKVEHWVPRWMAFPPSAYTQRGGVATVTAANRAAWLAEPDAPLDPDPAAAADGAADVAEDNDAETTDALDEAKDQRLAA